MNEQDLDVFEEAAGVAVGTVIGELCRLEGTPGQESSRPWSIAVDSSGMLAVSVGSESLGERSAAVGGYLVYSDVDWRRIARNVWDAASECDEVLRVLNG